MDGTAFARAYQQFPPPHAPIVVSSGAADAAPRARAIGAAAVLPKPFGVRALVALLERLAPS
jgi:CheY-like chemotaxis protein